MNFLRYWLVNSLVIIVLSYVLPGVSLSGIVAALAVGLILGLLSVFLKPILVLLTLPINLLTFGLFSLVINACLVLLAAWLVPGFSINGFGWALLFSFLLSLVSWFTQNNYSGRSN
ncbi:MAG: phage holin family protein [Patescibacteria group bacterium]